MADKLTITTDDSRLTVTDGSTTRTVACATATGAKAMAARFESDPEWGRQWLAATTTLLPSADRLPVSVRRIDRTVIIYADTGKPIRSCLCASLQDAVTLELKLAGDLDFAIWWVLGDRSRKTVNKSGKPR